MQTCTLAVDIGASSGRHIVGTVQNGKITLQEVYRFENGVHRENGHLCWDIDTLAKEVVNGLKAAHDAGFAPATIGIDTWAVDFVLLDADNKRIGDAVAYRDERTEGIREALEKEYGLTFADHYARTGIQYQPFNTVYQLMALKKEHPEQLAAAKTFLMVPDYLNYLLCGVPANEYTNASTTALVGADSRDWDDALIEKLGLPRGIFQPIKTAGTVLGHLTPEIQKAVGFDAEVILPATHDTGSAFLAVPARDEYAAYLSSGTWSLLGVENAAAITGPDSCAANFTNEGGYEYRYRYLKNIMGLWMIQSVRRELGEKTGTRPSFPELIAAAKEAADFPSCVDPDDNRFLAPASMIEEVRAACADTHQPVPAATGEVMQCVYNSLTQDYRRAVETLQSLTGKTYTSLNIVGGGSQDGYLNQQTANATGLTVFAGPTEGTALGNLMVQFIHSGDFADLAEARAAIAEVEQAALTAGWDGAWFRRAYDAFGKPVGSKECTEGQIFIEPQGMCVMAGIGKESGQAAQALASVEERLDTKYGVVLLQPAYTSYQLNLGEISSYPPGYKENAGIFCHNNPWISCAEATLGHGDRAFAVYRKTCPAYIEDISEIHRTEPYVYSQMVAGKDAPTFGEAKNSWLTGTAAWTFFNISQYILGIQPTLDGLRVDPCIPHTLTGYTVTRRFRGAEYRITVDNAAGVQHGVKAVTVDGKAICGNVLPLAAAGTEVTVQVTMG